MRFLPAAISLLGGACMALAGEKPVLEFSGLSQGAEAGAVRVEGDTCTLEIQRSGRAGRCTITTEKGKWPAKVAFVFKGINALEQFHLSTGHLAVEGSERMSGEFGLYFLQKDGEMNKSKLSGRVAVKVERQKDGFMVSFPANFFSNADRVTLGWVTWLD